MQIPYLSGNGHDVMALAYSITMAWLWGQWLLSAYSSLRCQRWIMVRVVIVYHWVPVIAVV